TNPGEVIALVGVGVVLLVFSLWSYVRTHHLLPTFPLLVLLVVIIVLGIQPDIAYDMIQSSTASIVELATGATGGV
ncbi:MAG: hypothetical protein SXQ77_09750, partial [Halobacteria archaeon]|nr:hypothetical protein [Halobacteria archaeon]